MRKHLIFVAFVGMVLSGMAEAREVPVNHYVPTGAWGVTTMTEGCRVTRDFADGRNRVTLWIDRYGPGSPLALALTGSSIRLFPRANQTRVSFSPGGNQDQPVQMYRTTLGTDELPVVVMLDVSLLHLPDWDALSPEEVHRLAGLPHPLAEELRLAQQVSTVSVNGGLTRAVELETGSLVEPITALQSCTDTMLSNWGLDPVVQNHLSRKVAASDGLALAQAFNYPAPQMRNHQGAGLRGYLIVGTDGQASQCHLTMASSVEAFNEEACRTLMSRAWFDPALDAAGNPVESYFTLTLRFTVN